MKRTKPINELPPEYHQINQLDLNADRGLAMILNLIGIGVLFGVAWLLVESLIILRPTYLSSENILVITGMREFWRIVLLLVVSFVLMVVLAEGSRWVLFWIITGHRPQISFRGFYTFAAAPGWYLPKWAYLLIRLLPIVLITLGGVVVIPFVPLNLIPGVLLVISLNIATGISDIVMVIWVMRHPNTVLITDDGDRVCLFHNTGKRQEQ